MRRVAAPGRLRPERDQRQRCNAAADHRRSWRQRAHSRRSARPSEDSIESRRQRPVETDSATQSGSKTGLRQQPLPAVPKPSVGPSQPWTHYRRQCNRRNGQHGAALCSSFRFFSHPP